MLDVLFDDFDQVRLKRNGTVVFKRHKFKFWDRTKIHASELVMKELPDRIENYARRNTVKNYAYYNPNIQENVINIINGTAHIDVIEYLWKEFTKIKFNVNKLKPSKAILFGESYLPNAFRKHRESLIRSPIINLGDKLSHIKKGFNNSRKEINNFNFKRILNTNYFPVRHLIAA